MKRKNTIHSHRGAAAATKRYFTFLFCHSTQKNYTSLAALVGVGVGVGWVQRFGHRSKDLSFTESSGPKHFSPPQPPSPPCSLCCVHATGAPESAFLRGVLAGCEHCSYTSVLNRDVNTNRFWQDPGPPRTHCRSRKKTNEKEGRSSRGWGGVGWEGSLALQQHHLSLRGELYNAAAQHTSQANKWVLVSRQPV